MPRKIQSLGGWPQDSQRQKLYRAEGVIAYCPGQKQFTELAQIRRYILALIDTQYVRRRVGLEGTADRGWLGLWQKNLNIRWKKEGAHGAHANGFWHLAFRPGSPVPEWLVIHELCHLLENHHFDRMGGSEPTGIPPYPRRIYQSAAHGPLFCRWYLDLVHLKLGRVCGERLKASYKAKGVRTRPYPTGPKRHLPDALRKPRTTPLPTRGREAAPVLHDLLNSPLG